MEKVIKQQWFVKYEPLQQNVSISPFVFVGCYHPLCMLQLIVMQQPVMPKLVCKIAKQCTPETEL